MAALAGLVSLIHTQRDNDPLPPTLTDPSTPMHKQIPLSLSLPNPFSITSDPEKHPNAAHHMASPKEMRKTAMIKLRVQAERIPLIAALLAPISTLFDIPALVQRWYTYFGDDIPDPPVCLALSAVGLGLNVLANVLLILRFSARTKEYWTLFTKVSTLGWIGKTVIAVVNLIVFGALTRNEDGFSYTEGFYSAITSVCISGIISLILLLHYFLAFTRNEAEAEVQEGGVDHDDLMIRLTGKHFMLSISFLFLVIGIQSLVYCKIEQWTYFDAIYYSVVTMLTVGFGDLAPSTIPGRILLLPFAILTISQLANEVSIIVNYFSDRAQKRRIKWRAKYETAIRSEAVHRNPLASLQEEIDLIDAIARREELATQLADLAWSLGSLGVFWVVGGAIFHAIEGWSFWTALYFEVEFCLTIGYGDITPSTPGGKVFFVIYSIMAVPLIASFVVQTVSGLLSTYSSHRARREEQKRTRVRENDAFVPHREFIGQHRDKLMQLLTGDPASDAEKGINAEEDSQEGLSGQPWTDEPKEMLDERRIEWDGNTDTSRSAPSPTTLPSAAGGSRLDTLTAEMKEQVAQRILDYAMQLEAISRRLLIDNLPKESMSRTLLIADREVQLRDVAASGGDISKISELWKRDWLREGAENPQSVEEAIEDKVHKPNYSSPISAEALKASAAINPLEQIRRYRETFAALLVAGAKLQNLEGDAESRFERVRPSEPRTVAEIRALAAKQHKEDMSNKKLKRMNTMQRVIETRRLKRKLKHAGPTRIFSKEPASIDE